MNNYDSENEIIEINSEENNVENENNIVDFEEEKKEEIEVNDNKKKKKKEKKPLTKKQKIIIIVVSILVLLLVVGLILFFVFKDDEEDEKPQEPTVVIEKDNYRYENGLLVFLNTNEKEIGKYECNVKDSEKCFVTKISYANDEFDQILNVYENGKELEKNSKIYLDRYVFVNDDGKIYLYDMETEESLLELNNIKIYNTSDNLVVIEDENNLYGLIEITEEGYEYKIRCSYDNLGIVNTEDLLLVAQDKDSYYIIESTGKKLSKNINGTIKSASIDNIVVEINNTYNLYDMNNEELLSDYDYISLHDGVIALVKNKRLYLIDKNLNKLNEDGIRITSTDYIKKYVYNDDNRLVETKKSYEVEVKGNIASVIVNDDITNINILEGSVSKNYNYLSYFDGKLYFYSDEDKLDLIGTYTCNNVNSIENANDNLNNCSIYTNEAGISGIYNNEYVFIYDSAISSDKVYYLYSLKDKKVKGTYSEIKIVNSSEQKSNIEHIFTSASYIIAKSGTGNNKGNYGVLEINSNTVKGKIGFNYKGIEAKNNYYILNGTDDTYSIYSSTFEKVSNVFKYIELFDNYYVGINNNKLNVYSYSNTLGILESDLNTTSNDFEIDFTNGFKITINGITYDYDKNGKKIVDNNNSNTETEDGNNEEDVPTEGENNGE